MREDFFLFENDFQKNLKLRAKLSRGTFALQVSIDSLCRRCLRLWMKSLLFSLHVEVLDSVLISPFARMDISEGIVFIHQLFVVEISLL